MLTTGQLLEQKIGNMQKRAVRGQLSIKCFSQDNDLIFNTTHAGINKVYKFQQLLNNT